MESSNNLTSRTSRKKRPSPPEAGPPLAPALGTINLLPYQRRWVEDDAKLKIVVKARQIGYSFAATLRAVLKCLEHKTTWVFLSKGERQSRLLMEKVQDHVRTCGIVARALESTFFEGTSLKQLEVRFANGSVIYGLPANPDTARGYSGHVTLDEFAFHADADKIYAALFPTITRGYGLEVISTPNGTQGKFYELAKAAGLTEPGFGIRGSAFGPSPPAPLPEGEGRKKTVSSPLPWGEGGPGLPGTGEGSRTPNSETRIPRWSAHYCDIYDAVRAGLKIDIDLLRSGCEDATAWQQEFCCQFVSTAENFFSPELLAACLSAEASTDVSPSHLLASAHGAVSGSGTGGSEIAEKSSPISASRSPNSEFFLGIDIGRHRDRTVFWVDEVAPTPPGELGMEKAEGRISLARLVRAMEHTPFAEQLEYARAWLRLEDGSGRPLIRRAAIDATGLGAHMAESLAHEFGPRVEPVVFTAAVKEDLAFRTRRRMEARLTLLPDTREIRRAFSAVKKFVTPAGNLRFDAARTEAGHADEFWAKALADLAADPEAGRAARAADAFLADVQPIVLPRAFLEVEGAWSALEVM